MRLILFFAVCAVHALLLVFLAFNISASSPEPSEIARIMRLTDIDEFIPAPPPPEPPPPEEETPMVEAIAETMIETDTEPDQIIVAPGTLTTPSAGDYWGDYLPIHLVSVPPQFDEREILSALVYPPIAHRSGIEGRVILELFVDRNGIVQQVRILQENPSDRGFGEAAVRAFTGRHGTPAYANGVPVSARYRYPVSFRIR